MNEKSAMGESETETVVKARGYASHVQGGSGGSVPMIALEAVLGVCSCVQQHLCVSVRGTHAWVCECPSVTVCVYVKFHQAPHSTEEA